MIVSVYWHPKSDIKYFRVWMDRLDIDKAQQKKFYQLLEEDLIEDWEVESFEDFISNCEIEYIEIKDVR